MQRFWPIVTAAVVHGIAAVWAIAPCAAGEDLAEEPNGGELVQLEFQFIEFDRGRAASLPELCQPVDRPHADWLLELLDRPDPECCAPRQDMLNAEQTCALQRLFRLAEQHDCARTVADPNAAGAAGSQLYFFSGWHVPTFTYQGTIRWHKERTESGEILHPVFEPSPHNSPLEFKRCGVSFDATPIAVLDESARIKLYVRLNWLRSGPGVDHWETPSWVTRDASVTMDVRFDESLLFSGWRREIERNKLARRRQDEKDLAAPSIETLIQVRVARAARTDASSAPLTNGSGIPSQQFIQLRALRFSPRRLAAWQPSDTSAAEALHFEELKRRLLNVAEEERHEPAMLADDTPMPGWEKLIAAAEKAGVIKVVSEPRLVCSIDRDANFHSGGSYPIPREFRGPLPANGQTQAVRRYKFGTQFTARYQALENGALRWRLDVMLSEQEPLFAMNAGGLVIPSFHCRSFHSVADLRPGQTCLVGGWRDLCDVQGGVRRPPSTVAHPKPTTPLQTVFLIQTESLDGVDLRALDDVYAASDGTLPKPRQAVKRPPRRFGLRR